MDKQSLSIIGEDRNNLRIIDKYKQIKTKYKDEIMNIKEKNIKSKSGEDRSKPDFLLIYSVMEEAKLIHYWG